MENRRFYLLFLRLIWDWDVILGLNAFYRWFGAGVTARKDFVLPFVAFYRWFCACGVAVGANLLLHFLVFDRLRTPVAVEADVLSSLIVFHNWFCKRATAVADFLGSSRKYILSLISHVSCWRRTETFLYFSLSISTLILWAIDFWRRCFTLVYSFCHWFCAQVTWTGPRLTGLPYLVDRATRLGGLPHLSCKHDQIKTRDYMERWVIPPRRVTSPTNCHPHLIHRSFKLQSRRTAPKQVNKGKRTLRLIAFFRAKLGTWWDWLVQRTGKYCSIRRIEYPEFQTGIFGRKESALGKLSVPVQTR